MNSDFRDKSVMRGLFIIAVTATLFATPALTQQPSQSAASIPDFSGTWAYLFCCGFQPPLSGPGPVANRSRRDGASDRYQYVGDYTNPILKFAAAEVVKKHGEIEASGVPLPTPRNHCWPEGVPFIFSDFGIQILQQSDKITIIYDHDHQVRQVRLNQPHPAHITPSWYGDSVGRYEDASDRHRRDQNWAVFNDRLVWHPVHPGSACGRTLSDHR
jgi:hypothetical protein